MTFLRKFGASAAAAVVAGLVLSGPASAQVSFWQNEFPMNAFDNPTIALNEITTVIRRDQIPAVDDPQFVRVTDDNAIEPREPVMVVEIDGDNRAYPLRYLMFHEIANDVVGGVPVAVTYCPLCNSGVVFDRRVEGELLSFGVSGKLRHSDMVMYDRETETFWQQAIGEGLVGAYAGVELTVLPAWMESFESFVARNPEGLVMVPPRAIGRYGQNPYVGYDSRRGPYGQFFNGEEPPHGIPSLMRVVRVGEQAWTLDRIEAEAPLTEGGITITWEEGQASAMDTPVIANGREVGNIRVKDAAGADLPHDVMFAFAFHAFFPQGEWMLGEGS